MSAAKFSTVEEYLDSLGPVKAKTMRSIIDVILDAFPGSQVKLAWNVPQIQLNGKYIAGLAAYKNHLTFAPWSYDAVEAFKDRLAKFKVMKGCFQVPVDWNVDAQLIKDLVQVRLTELGM